MDHMDTSSLPTQLTTCLFATFARKTSQHYKHVYLFVDLILVVIKEENMYILSCLNCLNSGST